MSWFCGPSMNLTKDIRKKVALFCNVELNAVIQSIDVSTIYEVPLLMQEEGLDVIVLKKLKIKDQGKPGNEGVEESLSIN